MIKTIKNCSFSCNCKICNALLYLRLGWWLFCLLCVDWSRAPTSILSRQCDCIITLKIHRRLGQKSAEDSCGVTHIDGHSSQYMPYKGAAQSQRSTGSDLPINIVGLCAIDENEGSGSGSGDGGGRLKDELRVGVSIAIESERRSRDGERT